jgi:hypothetical protein
MRRFRQPARARYRKTCSCGARSSGIHPDAIAGFVSGCTMATTRCHPGNVAALTMSLNLSSGISLGRGTLRRTTIGCRSRAFCCTSSRRGLTASGATPTTTPSATGASFAHRPRANLREHLAKPRARAQTSAYSSSCRQSRQVRSPGAPPFGRAREPVRVAKRSPPGSTATSKVHQRLMRAMSFSTCARI